MTTGQDRYPTEAEFWKRLDKRDVEDDLIASLRDRTKREEEGIERVGNERTVIAVIGRLIPDSIPPRSIGVFVDQVFDKQMGRADDPAGKLPRERMIPTGFSILDERAPSGSVFADLSPEQQDELLMQAERGELSGPSGFDSAIWFKRVRDLALLGFGSDPRGMVEMGFPGPSYVPGHIWLDEREIEARVERRSGYLEL